MHAQRKIFASLLAGHLCLDARRTRRLVACRVLSNSLALAAENSLRSVAFPAISTGAFGYPPELAAPVVSETIESVLNAGTQMDEVCLVFYETADVKLFLQNQKFTNR